MEAGTGSESDVVGQLGAEYFRNVTTILDSVVRSQSAQIQATATLVAGAVGAGKRIFVFGSGHSAIMGMEAHYRAGGLAAVTPIFVPELMVHMGAIESTRLERQPGIGNEILNPYNPESGDILFVFSTSGINNAPVEVALAGRNMGLKVVAVISLEYSRGLEARSGIPKLGDVADLVLDNGAPAGDAAVDITGDGLRCGPISTVTSVVLLNMILVSALGMVVATGGAANVYQSVNMPGAAARNLSLAQRFQPGNPHL